MGRHLARTVIVGGETVPAGTPESPSLSVRVTNPAAWDGDPDTDPPPAPAKRTRRKGTTD